MQDSKDVQTSSFQLAALLLLLTTLGAYLPAMNGGFIWDDDLYVLNNQLLRNFEGLKKIWFHPGATPQYYPLTYTTFWIEYHFWNLWPTGYHLVNIVLHACNAILLWVLLQRLAVPGAWLAAAIFALHPVHVESVAWITERKNVLSGIFYLTALLCYLRFSHLHTTPSAHNTRSWPYYFLALFLFLCALLSKTVTCSLPAAIVLMLWWKKERIQIKDILPLIPLFVIGLFMGMLTAQLEKEVVGAVGKAWDLSPIDRILIAGRALWFYVSKLFWPHTLTFIYPKWTIDPTVWWQYLFPISITVLFISGVLLRKKIGKAPLVAGLFFAGTLGPALGFFNVFPMRYSYVADHFQYLASIGIIALVVGCFWNTHSLLLGHKQEAETAPVTQLTAILRKAPYHAFVALCIVCTLGALTWKQGHMYKNLTTLWQDTMAKNPSSWLAQNNMGVLYADEGDYQTALVYFEKALKLDPHVAEVHSNLSLAYVKIDKIDVAIQHGLQAITLDPAWFKPYHHLGTAFWVKKELQKAARYFREAIDREPKAATSYYSLGLLYIREAAAFPDIAPREALSYIEKALALNPSSIETAYFLAQILATHPDPTVRNGARAAQLAEEACKRINYQSPFFLDTLAAAYAEAGRFYDALKTAHGAVALASAQNREELVQQIRERIQLYQAGIPYHRSLTQEDF